MNSTKSFLMNSGVSILKGFQGAFKFLLSAVRFFLKLAMLILKFTFKAIIRHLPIFVALYFAYIGVWSGVGLMLLIAFYFEIAGIHDQLKRIREVEYALAKLKEIF